MFKIIQTKKKISNNISINNFLNNNSLINKDININYIDKIKYKMNDDLIIEEKEEEQTEDNVENIYSKNNI